MHVEALDDAVANIPPEQLRMHLCSGNYDAAPVRRRALRRDRCRAPRATLGDRARGRKPAPRARVENLRDGEAAQRQDADPGVIESKSISSSTRARRAADRALRPSRRPGECDAPAATAASVRGSGQAAVDPDVVWAKMATMAEGARIASRGISKTPMTDARAGNLASRAFVQPAEFLERARRGNERSTPVQVEEAAAICRLRGSRRMRAKSSRSPDWSWHSPCVTCPAAPQSASADEVASASPCRTPRRTSVGNAAMRTRCPSVLIGLRCSHP